MSLPQFHTIRIAFLLFFGLILISCKKDFLDIDPKGYLIANQVSHYDAMLNDGAIVGQIPHILMSDELAGFGSDFYGSTLPFDQNAFKWADDIYLISNERSEFAILSEQLYIYNKVINEVIDAEGGSDQQKRSLRAEALASRAYTFFMLVNLYGKPYNSATSATDLGIPLVKIADVTQNKFTRASVQETYAQIISDLNEAIPNLPLTVTSRIRMSKAAAEALLGKVYVFIGRFEQALPLLNAAITDLQGASIAVGLYDFKKELAVNGAFYPEPSRVNTSADKEIVYTKTIVNLYSLVWSGVVLSPATINLFGNNDLRREFLSPYTSSMQMYPLGMLKVTGKSYSNAGINVPDIYLLRSECRSRLGDTQMATTELESFRKNRMPDADAIIPTAISNDKIALTKFILDERIREFAFSGDRWFDMRRLSVDPDYKHTIGTTHRIYDENGNISATFNLKPERLTLRIPLYIMTTNPGMPQNP